MNQHSQLCLEARGGPANHTPIQQWTCNSLTNENWSYAEGFGVTAPTLYSGDGNTGTGNTVDYCLDMPGAQPTPGLAMQLYLCNGTIAQKWFTP